LTALADPSGISVIFDLDGTLINSVPDVGAALNRMLEEFCAPPLSIEIVKSTVGYGPLVMIERALLLAGRPIEDVDLTFCYERYLSYYMARPVADTKLYPGVREVLIQLRSVGFALGICTNKPSVMTTLVLKELGLAQYFNGVAAGDDGPYKKPDGRHVELTLSLMGTQHHKAIMVGDSCTDIEAARDFGIPSVAVTYGYEQAEVRSLNADIFIDKFSELPDAITQIISGGVDKGRID
jgi:phosphoglycolate phosphatase